METLNKKKGDSRPGGIGWDGKTFIMLLKTAPNLKLTNYFWNFPRNVFGLRINETVESKTTYSRGLLYIPTLFPGLMLFSPCDSGP